jgi:hypothetical protein
MHIFDLSEGYFQELVSAVTRTSVTIPRREQSTQTLDIPRTLLEQGKRFCFEKTIYAEKNRWLPTPRETRVCYRRTPNLN